MFLQLWEFIPTLRPMLNISFRFRFFNSIKLDLGENSEFTITKSNEWTEDNGITIDGNRVDGYFISHDQFKNGMILMIEASPSPSEGGEKERK